jgi:hypothetical protein
MLTLNDPVPPAQEAWRSGEIDMGIIVEFPAEAARRAGPDMNMVPREGTATILILPAIRIERYADETSDGVGPGEGTAPGRRRKRRARS